jgi:predicted DCC family thiol-disulfide oxidoreductase YuxK
MAAPARVVDEHLVLYDGTCGLCSRVVRFVLRRDRGAVFRFAALQGEPGRDALARAGVTHPDPGTFVVVTRWKEAPTALTRSRAALFVAAHLSWPWRGLQIFGLLPAAALDRAYDLVARHRRRLFRRPDACALPAPRERGRFLD